MSGASFEKIDEVYNIKLMCNYLQLQLMSHFKFQVTNHNTNVLDFYIRLVVSIVFKGGVDILSGSQACLVLSDHKHHFFCKS